MKNDFSDAMLYGAIWGLAYTAITFVAFNWMPWVTLPAWMFGCVLGWALIEYLNYRKARKNQK